jgi:hypothetical protein
MGDGGSLVVGLLVARVTMAAVTPGYLGPRGVVVAALLVGMVIFDTTLVVISRSRAGVPVLTGGRDHLTHRLVRWLGSPRWVALTLALVQLAVCAVTIAVAQAGFGWVLLTGGMLLVIGSVLIWQFEHSALFGRESDGQLDLNAAPVTDGAGGIPGVPALSLSLSASAADPRSTGASLNS